MYETALLLHLLGVVLLVCGIALAGAGFESARLAEQGRPVDAPLRALLEDPPWLRSR